MGNQVKKVLALLMVSVAAFLALPGAAAAVDPPRWIAALYIAGQNNVGLRWAPVPGATGYKVLRSTTSGSGYVEIAAPTVVQHFETAIEPGATYYYVLQTVAGAETSANSDQKAVTIPGEKKKVLAPPAWKAAVLSQTIEFGKTISKVSLTYMTPPGGAPVAYNIYRSTVAGKDYQMLTSISETQYVDATVELGKTYYYVLSGLDQSFQETAYSEERAVEVKEPEKKDTEKRKIKEKIKILIRATRPLFEISRGGWGELKQPNSVAINSKGEIFVLDGALGRVFAFSPTGEFLFAWGENKDEPGDLNKPYAMTIDPKDRVYVTTTPLRVEIFSSEGRPVATVDTNKLLAAEADPKNRFVGRIGSGPKNWYMINEKNHRVYVMSYDANEIVASFGGLGKAPGQFVSPAGLTVHPVSGKIGIADMFNFRAQVLGPDYAPLTAFGSYGNSVGQFGRVIDSAWDGDNLVLIDFMNSSLQAFDETGKFLWVAGTEDLTDQIGMGGPTAFDLKGNRLAISNSMGAAVNVYELLDKIGPPVKK